MICPVDGAVSNSFRPSSWIHPTFSSSTMNAVIYHPVEERVYESLSHSGSIFQPCLMHISARAPSKMEGGYLYVEQRIFFYFNLQHRPEQYRLGRGTRAEDGNCECGEER